MVFTVAGMEAVVRNVAPEKAWFPMLVTPDSMTMEVIASGKLTQVFSRSKYSSIAPVPEMVRTPFSFKSHLTFLPHFPLVTAQ